MNYCLSFVLFFLLFFQINGQVTTYEYRDQEQKAGSRVYGTIKYNNTIIVAGYSFVNTMYYPSLICVDSVGNVLWNTATNDVSTYTGYANLKDVVSGNDGFLYASGYFGNSLQQLWKVDAQNGTIIWKKDITGLIYNNGNLENILDYDNSKIVISYRNSYNGSVYNLRISYMSKANGDVLSTAIIGDFPWTNTNYGIAIDQNNDIYYTKLDSLYKLSGADLSTILWRKKYAASFVESIQKIHCDTIAQTVYFIGLGSSGGHKIVKLNASDGTLVSSFSGIFGYKIFEDMKVVGDNFYFTWSHETVGGGDPLTRVTKYNTVTETMAYTSVFNFPENNGSDEEGVFSLDVDNAGDIFVTGYYGDANYGPANWGILKLNGATGDSIYSKRISGEHLGFDQSSSGISVTMLNDQPCFLGNLQSGYYAFATGMTFVQLDNATGSTLIQKGIGGDCQFPSQTIDISEYSVNQTLVLKQIGRKVKIEMYDSLKQVMWEHVLNRNYYLFGSSISVSPNGRIFCSATIRSLSTTSPYYSSTVDSILIFELNSTGQLINTNRFYLGISNVSPTELISDNLNTFIFYQKNNLICFRKLNSQILSAEYATNITYFNDGTKTKYLWNKDATNIYLFGKISGINKLIELNKSTLVQTELATIPAPVSIINYVKEIDSERIIICGKTSASNEFIGLYNTTVLDTIWTKTLTTNNNAQALQCTIDPQGGYIYLISSNNNDIQTRKFSVSTGNEEWASSYNGSTGFTDFPATIVYDGFRDQLIVGGYELDALGYKRPLVLIFDTLGLALDTLILTNEINGDGIAICSHILPDGSQWIGGNRNSTLLKTAGFIMECQNTYIPPCVPQPIVMNSFSMPSDANNCLGGISISLSGGVPDYTLTLDGATNYSSSGYNYIQNLCPGIHDLLIIDNCSDTLNTQIVIPVDSNYVYNNQFIDSLALDSLGNTVVNCTIYYNSIDTAYIDSIFNTGNEVTVIWTIFDSNGQSFDTSNYILNNGNGVYWLQLSVFCPTKSFDEYFAVTEAIYFFNGEVFLANIENIAVREEINVYPNPFTNELNIELPLKSGNVLIEDAMGRLVFEKKIDKHSFLSLESLNAGMYYLKIQCEGQEFVEKIVKK